MVGKVELYQAKCPHFNVHFDDRIFRLFPDVVDWLGVFWLEHPLRTVHNNNDDTMTGLIEQRLAIQTGPDSPYRGSGGNSNSFSIFFDEKY